MKNNTKVITITENNIKEVYGRLRKFFYNNNETGFEGWHNFDCGFKKHINRNIYINGKKVPTCIMYPAPDEIELILKRDENNYYNLDFIRISLTATDSFSLQYGDKIAFCGNRIILRTKCFFSGYKYIYSVYQVNPMPKERQYRMKRNAELEYEAWEENYCREWKD